MGELLQRAWDLDPAVLVDAGRVLPGWAGWLLLALGLGYAAFGAHHHALRVTAGGLAALVAFFAAGLFVDASTFGISPALLAWAAACALGVLGGVWPVAAAFVIASLAGGRLFSAFVPFEDPLLRALPGAIACGVLGAIFVRAIAALASAFVGASLAAVGVAGLLLQGGHADWLEPHPVVSLLPFSLVFVSGAAYQLTRRAPKRKSVARGTPAPQETAKAQLSGGGAA